MRKTSTKCHQFQISDEIYTVEFVSQRVLGNDRIGECNYTKHRIRILKTLPKKELFQTLLHELLHAITEEYHLNLKHKQIYALEKPLYEFLRDNF
jgi:hypothetical protein